MSKILITFVQPIFNNDVRNIVCFYESICHELKKNGNDIYTINHKLFIGGKNRNESVLKIEVEKVKQFNPDLIITFNNQIDESIIQNTNCPIAIFEADGVDFFPNTDFIKKYNDRYFLITPYAGWNNQYEEIGITSNKLATIHLATSIINENLEKDKNISFIGSNFHRENEKITNYVSSDYNQTIYKVLKEFWEHENYDYKSILEKYIPNNNFNFADEFIIFDNRIFILNSLVDLGLNLYGQDWELLASSHFALASVFDREAKYTLKHNQDIYNSSKINISISHPQTEGYAFPWRIYDIMASNGLLISSKAELLNKLTDGMVKIPMFHSPYDARDLCKKYLKEENLRNDIILASNEFIEKHGRWKSNFEVIEQVVGVELISSTDNKTEGTIKHQIPIEEIVSDRPTVESIQRIKNIKNALFLLLANVPIVDKLISVKRIEKTYAAINRFKIAIPKKIVKEGKR